MTNEDKGVPRASTQAMEGPARMADIGCKFRARRANGNRHPRNLDHGNERTTPEVCPPVHCQALMEPLLNSAGRLPATAAANASPELPSELVRSATLQGGRSSSNSNTDNLEVDHAR